MPIEVAPIPSSLPPGPAWEVARLFPDQGYWDEGDFLLLNRMTNRLVELVDGRIEVLDMPTKSHQKRARALADAIEGFCKANRIEGECVMAAYPLRVGRRRFREPDVVFAFDPDDLTEDYAERADLVAEVVSQDRSRDLIKKRREYARAGVPEYWIIDPEKKRVIVLTLKGGKYVLHGEYGLRDRAESRVLKGFQVEVGDLLG